MRLDCFEPDKGKTRLGFSSRLPACSPRYVTMLPAVSDERSILGRAEDFSTGASEQPERRPIVDRLGEEADMTVGE